MGALSDRRCASSLIRVGSVFDDFKNTVALNSDYPLSPLYNRRNLLKKMAEDETNRPRVSACGEDNCTAVVDDIVVNVNGIGDMFRGLLKDIQDNERAITKGLSEFDPRFQILIPRLFVDQPNKIDVDFWFADILQNEFGSLRDVMLNALVNNPMLRETCFVKASPSEVKINPAECHKFLRKCADLRLLLFSAMHISSGGPGRGTEIASHTLRNPPAGDIRNVQIIGGRLCFVGGYNKTSHLVSLARLTIRESWLTTTLSPHGGSKSTAIHLEPSSHSFCVSGWCTVRRKRS